MGTALACTGIMTMFCVIWLVKYPVTTWEMMMFRDIRSPMDFICGVLIWCFFAGTVGFFIIVADLIYT